MGTNARKRRIFFRQVVFLVMIGIGAVLGWELLARHQQRKDLLEVYFVSAEGRKTPEYYLRIAANEQARRQGLMYEPAEKLSNRRGMLFVFPEEGPHSFWMKNTPTSLDMIFLDRARTVVGIVANTTPFSLEGRSVEPPSQYVVELLAGTAARDGITTGSRMESTGAVPAAQ